MPNKLQKSILKVKDSTLIAMFFDHLLQYGGFKLTGFGVFNLKRMKAREGFNPYTKKVQNFPAYVKITFIPTKKLKAIIQKWK